MSIRCIYAFFVKGWWPVLTTQTMFKLDANLVPPAGVEPTLANYLLHTGYKSAVLPLNYRGVDWLQRQDSNLRFPAYETGRIDLFHTLRHWSE